MRKPVAVVTIGQSPRTDLIPFVCHFFTEGTEIVERGVLDGRTETEMASLAPERGQTALVSRLRNGKSVIMAKEKIEPAIQAIIDELNRDTFAAILLACTGKFRPFASKIPVVCPDYLLCQAVKGLLEGGKIGLIVPLKEQAGSAEEKWKEAGFATAAEAASPYDFQESALIEAVKRLDQTDAKAIVLDCIGYTQEMKDLAKKHTAKPVILPRSLIFRLLAELL